MRFYVRSTSFGVDLYLYNYRVISFQWFLTTCILSVVQDLFKRMNAELKKSMDATLSKTNRSTQFDVIKVNFQMALGYHCKYASYSWL